MKTKNFLLAVMGLSLAGACLSWGGAKTEAPSMSTVASSPDHPEPKARDIEHTRMIAPAVLTIEQGNTDASGVTEYFAHIDVQDRITYPVTLEISPGKDAQLLAGVSSEVLDLSGSMNGRVTRSFKVARIASDENPVKVRMSGQSVNAVVGFHAEKQYPPVPEMKVSQSNAVRPPGGRPPVAAPSLKNRGVGN